MVLNAFFLFGSECHILRQFISSTWLLPARPCTLLLSFEITNGVRLNSVGIFISHLHQRIHLILFVDAVMKQNKPTVYMPPTPPRRPPPRSTWAARQRTPARRGQQARQGWSRRTSGTQLLHPATPRGGDQAVMPTPRGRRLPPSLQGGGA